MPIPLLQRTRPVQTSQPLLPLGGQVSPGNYGQSIAAVGRAVSEPMPILDIAASQARAGGAVAGGLNALAGTLTAIALKGVEARQLADLHDAEMQVKDATTKHLEWRLRNPDPDQWGRHWEQSFGEVRRAVESRFPRGGDRMRMMLDGTGQRWQIQTAYDATKAQIGRAMEANQARISMAEDDGDLARVEQEIGQRLSLTGEAPEVGQAMLAQSKQRVDGKARAALEQSLTNAMERGEIDQVRQTVLGNPLLKPEERDAWLIDVESSEQANELSALAFESPTKAKAALDDPMRFPLLRGAKRDDAQLDVERTAEMVASKQFQRARGSIAVLASTGKLDGVKDIAGLGDVSELTEPHKVALAELLEEAQDQTPEGRARARQRNEASYVQLHAELGRWAANLFNKSPAQADLEEIRFRERAGFLPDEMRGLANSRIDEAKEGTGDIMLTGPALATLKDAMERGRPMTNALGKGVTTTRDPKVIGQVEAPGMLWGTNQTDVKENDGKPVVEPVMVKPTPAEAARNAAAYRRIEQDINARVKRGELKAEAEVNNAIVLAAEKAGVKLDLGTMPAPQSGPSNALFPTSAAEALQALDQLKALRANAKPQ